MRRNPVRSLASVLLSSLLLAGCSGTSGSAPERNDPASEPAAATPRTEQSPDTAPPPAAVPAKAIGDVRVMLYQPKGDLLLILVNESHSARKSEAGRINLALGDTNRAYKILTDPQMSALIESLENYGYTQESEPFVPGDEQYLATAASSIPRYQGMIYVERGGAKTKVIGFRKSSEGDAAGQRRYVAFTNLKALVQKWFTGTSASEYPVGGAVPARIDGGK